MHLIKKTTTAWTALSNATSQPQKPINTITEQALTVSFIS